MLNPNSPVDLSLHSDWLTPNWPAPPQVKAVLTTRAGGVSAAPFDSMNLGDHVGDIPAHVSTNRQNLQQTIAAKPVFLQQVHGTAVAALTFETANGTVADACITNQAHLACTIMVADCLPVLLTDVEGRFVAAAHAGWRGLAGGVLQQTLVSVYAENNAFTYINKAQLVTKLIAWLGPCIGPTAFEVGAEVKTAFASVVPNSESYFQPIGNPSSGKWLADLAGLARLQLRQLGLSDGQIYGNDGSVDWCTASNPSMFFSHRRDAARLGQQWAHGCLHLVGLRVSRLVVIFVTFLDLAVVEMFARLLRLL